MQETSSQELIDFLVLKETFGRNDDIIISITHEDIFNREYLQQLVDFHRQLEAEVPYTRSIKSLVNARHIYGEDDELIIEDLLDVVPEHEEALDRLKQIALRHPLYRDTYITADGKTNIDVDFCLLKLANSIIKFPTSNISCRLLPLAACTPPILIIAFGKVSIFVACE